MALCARCNHDAMYHLGAGCVQSLGRSRPICPCRTFVPSPSTPGRDLVAVILSLAVLAGVVWSFLTGGW